SAAQLEVLPRFREHGVWAALYNFSVGWPRLPESDGAQGVADMNVIADACDVARPGGHVLSLHEYGLPSNPWDTWWVGRHRGVWNALLDRDAPIGMLVTEYGIDYHLIEPAFLGWNSHGNEPEVMLRFLEVAAPRFAESAFLLGSA